MQTFFSTQPEYFDFTREPYYTGRWIYPYTFAVPIWLIDSVLLVVLKHLIDMFSPNMVSHYSKRWTHLAMASAGAGALFYTLSSAVSSKNCVGPLCITSIILVHAATYTVTCCLMLDTVHLVCSSYGYALQNTESVRKSLVYFAMVSCLVVAVIRLEAAVQLQLANTNSKIVVWPRDANGLMAFFYQQFV